MNKYGWWAIAFLICFWVYIELPLLPLGGHSGWERGSQLTRLMLVLSLAFIALAVKFGECQQRILLYTEMVPVDALLDAVERDLDAERGIRRVSGASRR